MGWIFWGPNWRNILCNVMSKFLLLFSIIFTVNIQASNFVINNSDRNISDYNSDNDAVEFQTDHELSLNISNSSVISSITTTSDNQGIINFNVDGVNLTIVNDVGNDDLRIGDLKFSVNSAAQTNNINSNNSGTFYIQNMDIGQDQSNINSIKTISGTAIINAENLNISQNLTLNNQANIGKINFSNQSSNAIFANLLLSGNVAAGSVTGRLITTSDGSITLNGEDLQNIQVALGDYNASNSVTTYLNQLNINNSDSGGITFESSDTNYVNDMIFNHNDENSQITLSNTIFHLNGDITNSNTDIKNFYILSNGSGKMILTGQDQDIDADFGQSTSSRFNNLQIQSGKVDFSGNLYLANLDIVQNADRLNALTILTNSGILDISDLDIDNNLMINGAGKLNINTIDISDNNILTLNLDSNISGNIVNSGSSSGAKILSNNNNITFNGGSSDQTISAIIGDSTNRVSQITISNSNTVTLDQNVFVTDIFFTNTSGGKLSIGSGDELDVAGNITAINANDSVITGSSGTLNLSGTSSQIIGSALGTNSVRLDNLNINNNQVIINNATTSYINNLNLNSGSITLNSGSIIDIKNGLDLNGKTLNYNITSTSNAAKITSTSSNEITTDSSNINIDYSNISGTGLVSYLGTSDDIIDNNSASSAINISNITLSDNSYLSNASLATGSSNKILTLTTNLDTNIVSIANLGKQNYDILTYLIQDLEISSLLSISNSEEFEIFQKSLIPKNNSNIKNNINLANNIDFIIDEKSIFDHEKYFWGEILASNMNHKKDSKQNEFTANNLGLIFGYNTKMNKNNLLGLSFFYANSNIESDFELQNDKNNSIGFSLYHNYRKNKKGYFNFNKLTSFYNLYSLERKIAIPSEERNSKATAKGFTVNLETGIGYKYNIDKISYIPKISYQYFRDQISSYKESGAGNLSLNIDQNIYNSHKLQLGLDLASVAAIKYDAFFLKPKFGINLTKKVSGTKNQKLNMRFAQSAIDYKIELPDINDDYLTVNLSIDIWQKEKLPIVSFKYIGNFSSDISSHLSAFNFKYNF